jgi:hypothetical protein
MSNLFFTSKGKMNFFKKAFVGLMMFSLNLSVGGVGTIFLTSQVVYAADTGFYSPTADVSNGFNDHWGTPTNAYGDGNLSAYDSDGDRHRFYDFHFNAPFRDSSIFLSPFSNAFIIPSN